MKKEHTDTEDDSDNDEYINQYKLIYPSEENSE
jgi:hypothetical protein